MENPRAPGWLSSFWLTPNRLSDEEWAQRHRIVIIVLMAHFPILLGIALFGGTDRVFTQITFEGLSWGHALFEAAVPVMIGVLALLPRLPRRVAAAIASIGLVFSSAVLTHLTGGYIEAHFHYFVMIGLAAIYVDWVPFALATLFVFAHHGAMGALEPNSVYNHVLAQQYPWRWAGIHGFFLTALGLTQVANIRLAQRAIDAAADQAWVARRQESDKYAAEAVSQARGDFLRHMSHEVRTPLNAILGMANLMSRDKESFSQERLDVISASGRHLLELIQQLLDMNQIDAGEIDITPRPVDLPEFAAQIGRIVRDSGNPGVVVEVVDITSERALLDPTRVRQVLLNLLGNAVKYGGATPISLTIRTEGDLLVFQVHDDGPGIGAEDLERIFEPYQQVGPEATRAGAGLGLAISRRLATAMGGRLSGESDPGKGTTFTFELPFVAAEPIAVPAKDRWTNWGEGRSILLAEDDPFSAMVATEFLEGGGVKVTVVGNGAEAVKKADDSFDAILLDARMPVMDGLGASVEIRNKGITAPIIGVSARATAADHAAASEAGMDAYLTKPIDFDGLVATLKKQWQGPSK